MKIKLLGVFILILLNINLLSQSKNEINKEALKYVKLIENGKGVMNERVGIAGTKPIESFYFDSLMLFTSEQELFELTNHTDAKVRCYAFWGLCKLNSEFKKQVLKNRREDEELVFTLNGCIGRNIPVNEFMNSKLISTRF